MQVIETVPGLRAALGRVRGRGMGVEFVPTMGALHAGHLSLIDAARSRAGAVVVSIFVNPGQFGPGEDFASYPRDRAGDLKMLAAAGVDVAFVPSDAEIQLPGAGGTTVRPGAVSGVCEGAWRPGHLEGVATVCTKLFNIVAPDRVYLGEKDAQQVAVIRQMVADLNFPLEIVVCPTVREEDGLAMSSRNRRLDPAGRRAAAVLAAALQAARQTAERGEYSSAAVAGAARAHLEGCPGVQLQYLEVVDPGTFARRDRVSAGSLLVVAALVGPVRLIDNVQLVPAAAPSLGVPAAGKGKDES